MDLWTHRGNSFGSSLRCQGAQAVGELVVPFAGAVAVAAAVAVYYLWAVVVLAGSTFGREGCSIFATCLVALTRLII